jgi:hypothetical protein
MDRIMGVENRTNNIVVIEDFVASINYVFHRKWIDVMDQNYTMNFMILTCQITAIISNDDVSAKALPFY